MARQTFTWYPDEASSADVNPSVEVVKFGDSYEQRVSRGINTMSELWDVKFTRSITEATTIRNFLKARGASEAFTWTTPLQEAGVFVCRSWRMTKVKASVMEISARFEQVFEA